MHDRLDAKAGARGLRVQQYTGEDAYGRVIFALPSWLARKKHFI
jgi:hypothetical protein